MWKVILLIPQELRISMIFGGRKLDQWRVGLYRCFSDSPTKFFIVVTFMLHVYKYDLSGSNCFWLSAFSEVPKGYLWP